MRLAVVRGLAVAPGFVAVAPDRAAVALAVAPVFALAVRALGAVAAAAFDFGSAAAAGSGRAARLSLRRTGRDRGRLVSTSRSESCRSTTCA